MSEIRANTVSNAAGTGPATLTGQYAAKVWCNFNGTGTIAIRDSFNVSSLTDNGTGQYTVSFTNNMNDGNYCTNSAASYNAWGGVYQSADTLVGSVKVSSQTGVNSPNDREVLNPLVHGDLA